MKKQSYQWGIAGIIVLATTFTLIAWTGNPQGPDTASNLQQDTIPAKKRTKVTRQAGDRDFDIELRAIDKANKELSEKDWDKVSLEIDEAMNKIDFEKIQADIDKAMKSVDFEKIQQEITQSLAKVDFEKLQKEIKESMDKVSKIDMEEMRADLQKAQKEIEQELQKAQKWNNEDFQKEMNKVKKEMEELKVDLKKEEFDFKNIMEKAGEEVQKAKEELKGYQEMVYDMEKEGLLSTDGDYTIDYRNGEISINGKKQTSAVSNRYKKYFSKNKVTIEKEDGEINIRHGSSDTHID